MFYQNSIINLKVRRECIKSILLEYTFKVKIWFCRSVCVCVVCSKLHRNCLRLKTPSYLRTCLLKLIWNLIYSWGLSDIDSNFLYVSISSKSSTNAQCPSVLSCMRNVMYFLFLFWFTIENSRGGTHCNCYRLQSHSKTSIRFFSYKTL